MVKTKNTNRTKSYQRNRIKVLLLLLIPVYVLNSFLYFLPNEIREIFIITPSNPNMINAYFSNFVHADLAHLLGNLVFYTLVVFFLIVIIEKDLKLFYIVSILIFSILPFFLSYSSVFIFPYLGASQEIKILGFSGIVSAYFGYFVVSFSRYLILTYGKKDMINLSYRIVALSFLFLFLNIVIWTLFFTKNGFQKIMFFYIILPSMLVLITSVFVIKEDLEAIYRNIISVIRYHMYQQRSFKGRILFSLGAFILFFLFIFLIFSLPFLITYNTYGGSIVNIISHYIGYVFGFMFPILVTNILTKNNRKQLT